jgi:O-antigen/teichoic acid export membrane protein
MWTEVVWGILDSGDRYIIQFLMGSVAVGHYSASYNISKYVQEVMLAPVGMALFPMCMTIWAEKGREHTKQFLIKTFDHFTLAGVGVLALSVLTARDVIVLLASEKYRSAAPLIPVILCGLIICGTESFFKAGLMIAKDSSSIFKVTACAAIFNISLNFCLIPFLGLQGAAIATLASYILYIGLLSRASSRYLQFTVDRWKITKYLTAGCITVFCLYHMPIANTLVRIGATILLSSVLYLMVIGLLDSDFRQFVVGLFSQKLRPVPLG